MTPVVNVPDVALIFEGGGMRAAYTSAVVVLSGPISPHQSR